MQIGFCSVIGREMLAVHAVPQEALRFAVHTAPVPWEGICVPQTLATNWSLKDLYSQRDLDRHETKQLATRVGSILHELNVSKARAPSVASSSGQIVDHMELTDRILLPQGIRIYRNKGLPADGTLLRKKGDAFLMSGGGCPAIVLTGGSTCIVAHASRESLLPKRFTEDGRAIGEHVSVVTNCVRKFRELEPDVPFDEANFRVIFGITPRQFSHPVHHPEHGANNRGRQRYLIRHYGEIAHSFIRDPDNGGYLDLNALTVHQARLCGIENAKTGTVLPAKGKFAYTRHPNPEMAEGRNLVIVRRLN